MLHFSCMVHPFPFSFETGPFPRPCRPLLGTDSRVIDAAKKKREPGWDLGDGLSLDDGAGGRGKKKVSILASDKGDQPAKAAAAPPAAPADAMDVDAADA